MKHIKIYKIIAATCLVIGFTGCTSSVTPTTPQNPVPDESMPSNTEEMTPSESPTIDSNSTIDQDDYHQEAGNMDTENVFETTKLFATEEQFVSHIEQGYDYLIALASSEMTQKAKDTLVHSAIKLGDFIFLGEPIGGWTYHDLSTATMKRISQIMLELDTVLQEKVPEQYGKIQQSYQKGKEMLDRAGSRFKEVWIDIIGEENYEYWGEQKDQAINKGKKAWDWTKKKYKDITEKQR